MRLDPNNPSWTGRDYFILSKGHASAALYATLAYSGFFPISDLDSYYQNGSNFPGHPTKGCVPGVEVSTGSLGHGLGVGCGIAAAAQMNTASRVFVLLSDGELDEGSVWEAILFAGARRLDNLIAIVDYNKIQSFGRVENVLTLEPIEEKFKAFGWATVRLDGNSIDELTNLFSSEFMCSKKPKVIIADTVKGKGVSFMENELKWHYNSPSEIEYEKAMAELV
jgi:transketolase